MVSYVALSYCRNQNRGNVYCGIAAYDSVPNSKPIVRFLKPGELYPEIPEEDRKHIAVFAKSFQRWLEIGKAPIKPTRTHNYYSYSKDKIDTYKPNHHEFYYAMMDALEDCEFACKLKLSGPWTMSGWDDRTQQAIPLELCKRNVEQVYWRLVGSRRRPKKTKTQTK